MKYLVTERMESYVTPKEPQKEPVESAGKEVDRREGRTYIVTEMCPHCMNEIEMRWDTDSRGFKAFCPVCGNRLMLCDECRHAENPTPCDYDSKLDCCCHNPPAPQTNGSSIIRVDTPKGAIIARPDPDDNGIWIDLRHPDSDDIYMAYIEYRQRCASDTTIVVNYGNGDSDTSHAAEINPQKIEEFFKAHHEGDGIDPELDQVCKNTPLGKLIAHPNSKENPTGIRVCLCRSDTTSTMTLAEIYFLEKEGFYGIVWGNGPQDCGTVALKYDKLC